MQGVSGRNSESELDELEETGCLPIFLDKNWILEEKLEEWGALTVGVDLEEEEAFEVG